MSRLSYSVLRKNKISHMNFDAKRIWPGGMMRMRRAIQWRAAVALIVWFSLTPVALFAPVAVMAADGEWREGRKIFRKCESCHTFKVGVHRFGPSLAGVFGREAGAAPDYKYSAGMKAANAEGLQWTKKTLDEFLTKPKRFIKGTRMQFPGLKKGADRANVIAYVKRRSARRKK